MSVLGSVLLAACMSVPVLGAPQSGTWFPPSSGQPQPAQPQPSPAPPPQAPAPAPQQGWTTGGWQGDASQGRAWQGGGWQGGTAGWNPRPMPRLDRRDDGEMVFLLATSAVLGAGTGVGIDLAADIKEPGLAVIAPLSLGVALPVGMFFLDRELPFHRGVASSVATGTLLGILGGTMLSTTHYAFADDPAAGASAGAYTLVPALTGAIGGLGGYAFGEWLRPPAKSLTFISSASIWGGVSGAFIGAGASATSNDTWKGAALGGTIGVATSVVGSAAMSAFYKPSYDTQKGMWLGYGAGVAATSLVYIAYAASPGEPKRGLIANGLGGLAGVVLAGVFAFSERDTHDEARTFEPPFLIGFAPDPSGQGGVVTGFGVF